MLQTQTQILGSMAFAISPGEAINEVLAILPATFFHGFLEELDDLDSRKQLKIRKNKVKNQGKKTKAQGNRNRHQLPLLKAEKNVEASSSFFQDVFDILRPSLMWLSINSPSSEPGLLRSWWHIPKRALFDAETAWASRSKSPADRCWKPKFAAILVHLKGTSCGTRWNRKRQHCRGSSCVPFPAPGPPRTKITLGPKFLHCKPVQNKDRNASF